MMNIRWTASLCAALLLVLAGTMAWAQNGNATYDQGDPISLTAQASTTTNVQANGTVRINCTLTDTDFEVNPQTRFGRAVPDTVDLFWDVTGGQVVKGPANTANNRTTVSLTWTAPNAAGTYAVLLSAKDSGRMYQDAPASQILEFRVTGGAGGAPAYALRVSSNPQQVTIDQNFTENVQVSVQLTGRNNANQAVRLLTSGGQLATNAVTTDANGRGTADLSVGTADVGTVRVVAYYTNVSSSTSITVRRTGAGTGTGNNPGNSLGVQVDVYPPQLPADGFSRANVVVRITDQNGDPVGWQPVVFRSSAGRLDRTQAMTDAYGVAQNGLISGNRAGPAIVTIEAGNRRGSAQVNFTPANMGGYPGTGYPGTGYPGTGYPGTGYPGTGYPGMGYPGTGYPGTGYPGTGYPGTGYPGTGYPGTGYPGTGNPGAGTANQPSNAVTVEDIVIAATPNESAPDGVTKIRLDVFVYGQPSKGANKNNPANPRSGRGGAAPVNTANDAGGFVFAGFTPVMDPGMDPGGGGGEEPKPPQALQNVTLLFATTDGKLWKEVVITTADGRGINYLTAPTKPSTVIVTVTAGDPAITKTIELIFKGKEKPVEAPLVPVPVDVWKGRSTAYVAENWELTQTKAFAKGTAPIVAQKLTIAGANDTEQTIALGPNGILLRDQNGVARGYVLETANAKAKIVLLNPDGTEARVIMQDLTPGAHLVDALCAQPAGNIALTVMQNGAVTPELYFYGPKGEVRIASKGEIAAGKPLIALSADGFLGVALQDGTVRIYKPDGNVQTQGPRADTMPATAIAVGQGGAWVAVASSDPKLTDNAPKVSVFVGENVTPDVYNMQGDRLFQAGPEGLVICAPDRTAYIAVLKKETKWAMKGYSAERFLAVGNTGIVAGYRLDPKIDPAAKLISRVLLIDIAQGKGIAGQQFQDFGTVSAIIPPEGNSDMAKVVSGTYTLRFKVPGYVPDSGFGAGFGTGF